MGVVIASGVLASPVATPFAEGVGRARRATLKPPYPWRRLLAVAGSQPDSRLPTCQARCIFTQQAGSFRNVSSYSTVQTLVCVG